MKKKKFFLALAFCLLFAACALNREYVKDYGKQMQIMRNYFPELYELYQRGAIVVVDVYLDKSDNNYHVTYHYR